VFAVRQHEAVDRGFERGLEVLASLDRVPNARGTAWRSKRTSARRPRIDGVSEDAGTALARERPAPCCLTCRTPDDKALVRTATVASRVDGEQGWGWSGSNAVTAVERRADLEPPIGGPKPERHRALPWALRKQRNAAAARDARA